MSITHHYGQNVQEQSVEHYPSGARACIAQYLELLHLLLLLGLPLTDDAEHLAHHRLDPLRERLREGLPEEESVEDGLAPVVTCATPPARRHSETPARVGLPYCSAPHVDSEGTWLGLGA